MSPSPTRAPSLRLVLAVAITLPLLASACLGAAWTLDRRATAVHTQKVAGQIEVLSALSQMEFAVEYVRLGREVETTLERLAGSGQASGFTREQWVELWHDGELLLDHPERLDSMTEGKGSRLLAGVLARRDELLDEEDPGVISRELSGMAANLRSLANEAQSHADSDTLATTGVFDHFAELQTLLLGEARAFIRAIRAPAEHRDDVIEIIRSAARSDALIAEVAENLPVPMRRRMMAGLAQGDMRLLRDAIAADAGISAPGPSIAEVLTPERFQAIGRRYLTLPLTRDAYTELVRQRSDAAMDAADRWLTTGIAVVAAVTLLLVATLLMVSRRVVRRLERVAATASRIGDGEIDDEPLPDGGTREVSQVVTAFNRMCDLLRTLERQVAAIGAARLDDPSLRRSLPGRIGSEIQQSVQLIAETNERWRAAQALANAIVDAAVDAIVTVDAQGRIRSANPAAGELLDRDAATLVGEPISELFPNLPAFDVLTSVEGAVAVLLERQGAESVSALVSASGIDEGDVVRTYFIRDISERSAWEQRFRHQATHDELTDLPNRFALVEHLAHLAGEASVAESGHGVVVLCVDVDRFKHVNDAHGHVNGDQVIRVIADRLRDTTGADLVARIDGDEFIIVVRPSFADADAAAADPAATTECPMTAYAEAMSALIAERIAEPIEITGERLVLQCCIGIATSDSRATDEHRREIDELLRCSEVALSVAKRNGTGSIQSYDSGMSALVAQRTRLEQRLRTALATDELEMYAQPIVDLPSGAISGVELLARWRLEGEWVPPDVFIPIAEDSGLVGAVGRWAMGRAVELMEQFRDAGYDYSVAVNISGLHLIGGDVVGELEGALAGRDLDRSRLRVELTESVLLTDPELAAERLAEIRALGAKIVIDDFGTGYSSLTYLHALPIDGLKLDRSFVSRLGAGGTDDRAGDETIVRLVSDLAIGLGLDLVAEGVETPEQLALLSQLGYPKGQGYLWARPMPIDRLWSFLADRASVGQPSSS